MIFKKKNEVFAQLANEVIDSKESVAKTIIRLNSHKMFDVIFFTDYSKVLKLQLPAVVIKKRFPFLT